MNGFRPSLLLSSAALGGLLVAGSLVAAATPWTPWDPATPWSADAAAGAAPEADPAPDTVTVTVSGDLLWHPAVYESGMTGEGEWDGGWDFDPVFAPIREFIAGADLSICHEEVPFAPPEGPFFGYPQFQAPPQIAAAVRDTGWDLCTTASNHSVDAGAEGLFRTLDAFEDAGVLTTGTARSPEEDAAPTIFTTDSGVRIAVVGGTYGTNGLPVPEPWMVQDLDPDELLAKAAAARAAGADIVLMGLHAGDEETQQPNAQQEALAEILTRSPDVDVVYQHSSHAVQPIEKVNGKWVVYGVGNLIGQQLAENHLAYEGIMVRFGFRRDGAGGWAVSELTYVPTMISDPGVTPVRATPVSALGPDSGVDEARVAESLARTRAAVLSRGAGEHPEVREG